jgi:hypothetical protein
VSGGPSPTDPAPGAHREPCPHLRACTREAVEASNYDLKAVNPHRLVEEDRRTPEELLDEIERQQKIIAEAIAELRRL